MKIAKDNSDANDEGNALGLSAEELAFYDALTKPQAVRDVYENQQLVAMTKKLTEILQINRTIKQDDEILGLAIPANMLSTEKFLVASLKKGVINTPG